MTLFGRRIAVWVLILIAVNLVVLAAYVWSRGGQTTHIRVEARGSSFTTYVDGSERASGRFDAPDAGGVAVAVDTGERADVPSLPEPRGIDSVRVTDLDTGETLFEDDFDGPLDERWRVFVGEVTTAGGIAKPAPVAGLRIDENWRDYAVDVRFNNVLTANVAVRSTSEGAGVVYSVRPFKEYDDSLSLLAGGGVIVQTVPGTRAPLSEVEIVRSMVAILLRPYPYVVLVMALALLAMIALQFVPRIAATERTVHVPAAASWIAASAAGAAAFFTASYLIYSFASHQPHVPDELSYIFQAKLFASFDLSAPPPPVAGAFDTFSPPLIPVADGRWASAYPFGHPLMLTAGVWAGAVWIVPPMLGGASVVALFALGRRLYNTRTALLAAALLATSPFFLMISGSFMSHSSAMFYLLCSLLCLVYGERWRPAIMWCLAGVFFGLLFNTRPLTALGLMPPLGVALLVHAALTDDRRLAVMRLAAFLAGGLLMVGAYLGYNYGTGGDALENGYQRPFPVAATLDCNVQACGSLDQGVGFGGRHSGTAGLENEQVQLALLVLVAHGWPVAVGLSFAMLPFLLGTRRWLDWLLLVSVGCVLAAWAFFEGTGIMYGPRYWYEALPLLMLLSARGAERAANFLVDVTRWLTTKWSRLELRHAWPPYVAAYACALALCGFSVYAWLFGNDPSWKFDNVPEKASALRGLNGIDGRLNELIDDADLENALVVVEDCPHWQCYGTVFWRNSPTLDGDVVYARDNNSAALFEAFPDRLVYAAGGNPPYLTPYGAEPGTPLSEAKPASETQPVGRATVTPPSPEAEARDAQRRADLATIAGGLEELRRRGGSYPNTNGDAQRVCLRLETDVGCSLGQVLDFIPQDPLRERAYFYRSSATDYTLFAQMELAPDQSACPDPLPFAVLLYERSLYCVSGP